MVRPAGCTGGAGREHGARAAERCGWAQRGGAISTYARSAAGVSAAAGVDAERSEQEVWRNACRRCECQRLEGLRLVQAESKWQKGVSWLWASRLAQDGGRGAGVEAGAGRLAARDAAVVLDSARDIGEGRINRWADKPACVSVRRSER